MPRIRYVTDGQTVSVREIAWQRTAVDRGYSASGSETECEGAIYTEASAAEFNRAMEWLLAEYPDEYQA